MVTIALAMRLALAVVFAIAGVAKLRDRGGSEVAFAAFGVTPRATPALAFLLPALELGVAAALLPAASSWWAAVLGVLLLLAFCVAVARVLLRGEAPECNCFGQLHSVPTGKGTLGRNVALLVIACFVIFAGRDGSAVSAVAWVGTLTPIAALLIVCAVALALALSFQTWFGLRLLAQNGRLAERLDQLTLGVANPPAPSARDGGSSAANAVGRETADVRAARHRGLPIGSRAPDFTLSAASGATVSLTDLRGEDKPIILIFSDPNCAPCKALMPRVSDWQTRLDPVCTVVVIGRALPDVNPRQEATLRPTHFLIDTDRQVAEAYLVAGTPTGVQLTADGLVDSALAPGAEEIKRLINTTVDTHHRRDSRIVALDTTPPARSTVGDVLPAFSLHDVDGASVNSADVIVGETVLLSWNPSCPFCERLLPELADWERGRTDSFLDLVIVSSGQLDQIATLESRKFVDVDPRLRRRLGIAGTPSAIRIDAEGRIASHAVAGGPAVMNMLRNHAPASTPEDESHRRTQQSTLGM